ncbi:unnamed protein product, partial [Prorocentrum cordatum]
MTAQAQTCVETRVFRPAEAGETGGPDVVSKRSAAEAGYVEDPLVSLFAVARRRPPLINRGYWIRAVVMDTVTRWFLESFARQEPSQVLSLGAGFDASFFRLSAAGELPAGCRYYEVDFDDAVARKRALIDSDERLRRLVSTDDSRDAAHFVAVGADLRDLPAVEAALAAAAPPLDVQRPTLVLAEVALAYLSAEEADAVLRWVSSRLPRSVVCVYEQVAQQDAFGRIMCAHYAGIDSPLGTLAGPLPWASAVAALSSVAAGVASGRAGGALLAGGWQRHARGTEASPTSAPAGAGAVAAAAAHPRARVRRRLGAQWLFVELAVWTVDIREPQILDAEAYARLVARAFNVLFGKLAPQDLVEDQVRRAQLDYRGVAAIDSESRIATRVALDEEDEGFPADVRRRLRSRPRATPDTSGLEAAAAGSRAAGGAAQAPERLEHVARRQKDRAKILKQLRQSQPTAAKRSPGTGGGAREPDDRPEIFKSADQRELAPQHLGGNDLGQPRQSWRQGADVKNCQLEQGDIASWFSLDCPETVEERGPGITEACDDDAMGAEQLSLQDKRAAQLLLLGRPLCAWHVDSSTDLGGGEEGVAAGAKGFEAAANQARRELHSPEEPDSPESADVQFRGDWPAGIARKGIGDLKGDRATERLGVEFAALTREIVKYPMTARGVPRHEWKAPLTKTPPLASLAAERAHATHPRLWGRAKAIDAAVGGDARCARTGKYRERHGVLFAHCSAAARAALRAHGDALARRAESGRVPGARRRQAPAVTPPARGRSRADYLELQSAPDATLATSRAWGGSGLRRQLRTQQSNNLHDADANIVDWMTELCIPSFDFSAGRSGPIGFLLLRGDKYELGVGRDHLPRGLRQIERWSKSDLGAASRRPPRPGGGPAGERVAAQTGSYFRPPEALELRPEDAPIRAAEASAKHASKVALHIALRAGGRASKTGIFDDAAEVGVAGRWRIKISPRLAPLHALDLNELLAGLPLEQRRKAYSLELFDEFEEWRLKCAHYAVCCGAGPGLSEALGAVGHGGVALPPWDPGRRQGGLPPLVRAEALVGA